jgi:hypothetical protein
MKKHIYIFLTAVTLLVMVSCESLIDEKVYSYLVSSNLYSNTQGCDAALTGVYGQFLNTEFFGRYAPQISTSYDLMFTRTGTQVSNNFTDGVNNLFFERLWNSYFLSINRSNDVIYNVSRSGIPQADKNRILGEAHFLRAMLYFDVVRYYGGVPLRTEPTTQTNINMPRATVDQVYTQIISDLDTAKVLMVDQGKQVPGRPHKMAAYALEQKVYLTLAGNDPTSPYWQKSLDNGLVVYNSQAYQLVKPFASLWDVKKQNSVESIFEIQASMQLGTINSSMTQFFLPNGYKFASGNRAKVNKEVYDSHVKQYPGDPRVDATYLDSSYVNITNGKTTKIWPLTKTGTTAYTYIMKYFDPAYAGSSSNSNYIYLRYADVLLMLAEAENEINGPDGAYNYVNAVLDRARDRNGNGVFEANEIQPADWSGMTQDQFRTRIMDERKYELMGELQTYFDIRRRGKDYLKQVIILHNTYPANITAAEYTVGTDSITLSRAMLLAIPQIEMSTNTSLKPTDQNPGY